MMESLVISDNLKELLVNKEVRAAVFTTYSFEPDFFELEVIPLLLPGNTPFSSDDRVKTFQVREALRESGIAVDVFYDLTLYRREGQGSPAMEYGCHGVYRDVGAFHGKVVLILAWDVEHEADCLLVGAGSNNLTRSGWWDNIECQHWEEVWSGETSLKFINRLKEDVAYLSSVSHGAPERGALEQIEAFLEDCRSSHEADGVSYYNLDHINKWPRAFPGFMREQAKELWSDSKRTLEIISPYFARQTDNTEHAFFFDLGVQEIHMLLPKSQSDEALVDLDYFAHINEQDGVCWADWSPGAAKVLGLSGLHYRRLHAKIYHFYNKRQSWVFVGSVNFSKQAMQLNVEAGFLVKLPSAQQFLQPIKDPSQIERFSSSELEPGVDVDDEETVPPIYLRFDWKGLLLMGSTEAKAGLRIQILNAERSPVIDDWEITCVSRRYEGDTTGLQDLLGNGSLVRVNVWGDAGEALPEQTVLLQQTGWTHKPLSLPDLTPEQILAIYADLSPERRQLMLMNAQIKKLVLEHEAGELSYYEDARDAQHFFSEYAEIFHAFRQLRRKMLDAFEDENFPQVDYYLTGSGVDSLPTLVKCTQEDVDEPMKAVTAYLVLLCAREIYELKPFRRRPLVKQTIEELERRIAELKASDRVSLEDNSPQKRDRFFAWFEGQFFKDYRARASQ